MIAVRPTPRNVEEDEELGDVQLMAKFRILSGFKSSVCWPTRELSIVHARRVSPQWWNRNPLSRRVGNTNVGVTGCGNVFCTNSRDWWMESPAPMMISPCLNPRFLIAGQRSEKAAAEPDWTDGLALWNLAAGKNYRRGNSIWRQWKSREWLTAETLYVEAEFGRYVTFFVDRTSSQFSSLGWVTFSTKSHEGCAWFS